MMDRVSTQKMGKVIMGVGKVIMGVWRCVMMKMGIRTMRGGKGVMRMHSHKPLLVM
jgi:hypothetical protein